MINYSITSLYSGSKGNSVLIESDNAKILIDAGKSARALCNSLVEIGKSIDEIDAIFITHEHNDHINALEILLKKHKIPVHIVGISANKLLMRSKEVFEDILNLHTPIFNVNIGNMNITSFPTPHDSEYSVEFSSSDEDVAFVDEMGYVKGLKNCDVPTIITVKLNYLGETFTDTCVVNVSEE